MNVVENEEDEINAKLNLWNGLRPPGYVLEVVEEI